MGLTGPGEQKLNPKQLYSTKKKKKKKKKKERKKERTKERKRSCVTVNSRCKYPEIRIYLLDEMR